MNKRQLYESIMRNVSREVKKALNEYDYTINSNPNIKYNSTYLWDDNHFDKANNYLKQDEFVDLGLPSGTLWCNHNVGAICGRTAESWYGDYYAWGETETKNEYNQENYKYYEDDVAQLEHSKMSRKVKMPTRKQLEELLKYTNNKWITDYNGIKGLNGRIFTGDNGNSIFIPAAGFADNSENYLTNSGCFLWSNSLSSDDPNYAWYFFFNSGDIYINRYYRYYGLSVRGVC